MTPGITSGAIERFLGRLGEARGAVLMLDYDGTLTEPGEMREHARPRQLLLERLTELVERTDTRVAIVSERPIWELQQLLGELSGRMDLWGARALESLDTSGVYKRDGVPESDRLRLVQARLALMGICGRSRVSIQPGCVSVHLRGLEPPAARTLKAAAIEALEPFARSEAGELSLRRFRDGVELRSRAVHKGLAVREMVARHPEAALAYVGDDMSDEDAFSELGARGFKVLATEHPRPTQADAWLTTSGELEEFMRRWARQRAPEPDAP
jgi:trehalose-phosphatase